MQHSLKKVSVWARGLAWVVATTLLAGCAQTFKLSYTADELNGRMKPLFPLEQHYGPFLVKLTQPRVQFNAPENRLGVRFDLNASGLGVSVGGNTLLEGAVQYRPDARAFYLVNPAIKELNVNGMPQLVQSPLLKALNVVAGLALQDKPIYTLNPGMAKEALAISHLKDVRVVQDRLVVEVGF